MPDLSTPFEELSPMPSSSSIGPPSQYQSIFKLLPSPSRTLPFLLRDQDCKLHFFNEGLNSGKEQVLDLNIDTFHTILTLPRTALQLNSYFFFFFQGCLGSFCHRQQNGILCWDDQLWRIFRHRVATCGLWRPGLQNSCCQEWNY
jgi:hypothetical protein